MRSVENDFSADRLFLSSNRKKTQGVKSINPRRDSQLDECAEKRGINSLSLYVAATYEHKHMTGRLRTNIEKGDDSWRIAMGL